MSKFKITIIILLALFVFAGADYYLNNLQPKFSTNNTTTTVTTTTNSDNKNNTTKNTNITPQNNLLANNIKLNDKLSGYKVVQHLEVKQVFDKIDLSNVKNIKIYKNILTKEIGKNSISAKKNTETPSIPASELKPSAPKIPRANVSSTTIQEIRDKKMIYLYEIKALKGKGSAAYLDIKNQFTAQINSITEIINETSSFGNNSFFFNNSNYKNTAFLVVQINDTMFAFQYDKADSSIYEDVKNMIKIMTTADMAAKTITN